MCIGYDVFKWADNCNSEEEYMEDLIMSSVTIDLDVITKEMDELKDQKARYEFELKKVKEEIEKRELQLTALLSQSGVNEMQYGIYSFGFVTKTRTALDQKYLKEHYKDIAEKCTFTKESESFEFKINKY